MLSIQGLITELEAILKALRVPYRKASLEANLPPAFIVDLFGAIIVGFERVEYSIILTRVESQYKGYRFVPVTTMDDMLKAKDNIMWELMRSGYMRYIRQSYPSQFKNLIFEYGLGRKIINERLRLWDGKPMHKYLIDENQRVLNSADQYTLAMDPAFYDYMPEQTIKHQEE